MSGESSVMIGIRSLAVSKCEGIKDLSTKVVFEVCAIYECAQMCKDSKTCSKSHSSPNCFEEKIKREAFGVRCPPFCVISTVTCGTSPALYTAST